METGTRLKLDDISKKFGEHIIADHLSLSWERGIHILIGENGVGKSSLLKIMMGLTLPDTGRVYLLGEDTLRMHQSVKRRLGFLFANDRTLFYKLTASENLQMVGRFYGLSRTRLKTRVPELLEKVGLKEEGKYIETFSTGMKKRLMLARAILHEPEILFLDEPFNGLDEEGHSMAVQVIGNCVGQDKLAILVTHQDQQAFAGAIRYRLEKGVLHALDR